ncbi:MAG: tRNA pseudouridine(38-40) synthase TruA [Ruminococcaceae bacterium]|nr:tRNA pseudouridine(38-40) synthase TruA [Oscillospiraceae bacterium]
MRRLLLKICYDGTNYCGWQVQPNGISVQQKICEALFSLLGEKTDVTGCSRTDSGVHANEFYCHFTTGNQSIDNRGFIGALNVRLPDDISVIDCIEVNDNFHARYDALGKRYIYKLYYSPVIDPFKDKYSLRVPKRLNIERISEFCKNVIGTHDFEAFSAAGKSVTDTVRTVYDCSFSADGDDYTFTIEGNGFLYNMVRILVGTALAVSDGKLNPDDFSKIIQSKNRALAGKTVPPHGLYLNKVFYERDEENFG